jgi:hypothetical protein
MFNILSEVIRNMTITGLAEPRWELPCEILGGQPKYLATVGNQPEKATPKEI